MTYKLVVMDGNVGVGCKVILEESGSINVGEQSVEGKDWLIRCRDYLVNMGLSGAGVHQ